MSRSGPASSAITSDMNGEKAKVMRTDPVAKRSEATDEPRDATQPGLSFAEDVDVGGRVVGRVARTGVDLDTGPDEDDNPPSASANRTDPQGRNGSDGAMPEGGMIRI